MPKGKFVLTKVQSQYTLGADSGTKTFDLPVANYLQGILLRVQNTNGATSNTGETIESSITKIEVIANGDPIYQVNSGILARKFEQFDIGNQPPSNESQEGSAVQWANFPIKFGRDDFDKNIILPAHMLNQLQLRITWAFTDSSTAGWATSETNAKVDIICKYLVSNEFTKTPFFKKTEIYQKTPTSTGKLEINLPVGSSNGAYRRLMLYCYEASIEDGVDITDYEVVANDSMRLIDQLWTTSQIEDAERYRAKHSKKVVIMKSDADTYASRVSRINSVAIGSTSCTANAYVESIAGDTLTLGLIKFDGTANSTDTAIRTVIEGEGISHATMMDFGTDDIEDSLDVTAGSGVSSLKVKYTVGATGGDTRLVTEQLVSF